MDAMRAIKDADAVLFIIDSRFPELSRNKDLENKLSKSNKDIFIVFNKIDLISNKKQALRYKDAQLELLEKSS